MCGLQGSVFRISGLEFEVNSSAWFRSSTRHEPFTFLLHTPFVLEVLRLMHALGTAWQHTDFW